MNEIVNLSAAALLPGALLLAVCIGFFLRFESQTKNKLQAFRDEMQSLERDLQTMEFRCNSIQNDREKIRQDKAPAPIVPPAEPTALEKRKQEALLWSDSFRTGLRACSAATGLPVEALITEAHRLAEVERDLSKAQSESALDKAIHAEARLRQLVMTILLSKSDRDIDPSRTNIALQEGINAMAASSQFTFISPHEGDPVDRNLHILLGVDTGAGAHLRGLVSSVRARGLMNSKKVVLSQAEVRQYD